MSIGIDIGKFSIKIVELISKGDQIEVKNIGSLPIFSDINKFNLEKITRPQLEASLQDLASTLGMNPKKTKNIVTSLPGSLVDIREISTLDMEDQELAISLELEAKKHIPLDGTDAIIDYHHLGSNKQEIDKINIILTSTTKNIINEHATLVKNAGFKPNIFDADPIAISNLYKFNFDLPEEGCDVILNIGNSSSNIIAWGKNSPFFTRTIESGGNFFTKEVIKTFNTDYQTAETMKIQKGINVFDDDKKEELVDDNIGISIEKKTAYNTFAEDIRKTLKYYMRNNSQTFLNNFYITGGSSSLSGLEDFIANNLNVKVHQLDPFKNISNSIEVENLNQFSIAIGLALRGLEN